MYLNGLLHDRDVDAANSSLFYFVQIFIHKLCMRLFHLSRHLIQYRTFSLNRITSSAYSKMENNEKVFVGCIGGSGLYHLDNLTFVKTIHIETPWGKPSSPINISSLPSGALVAFISRHGSHHSITPSEVPCRANIAALKHIGCEAIIAFSAVGSLREDIAPGHFIIPDQIIDRTKGIREDTFFRGEGLVVHSMFGEPFSQKLNAFVAPRVEKILKETGDVVLHTGKTVVCMEGPAFSTRAESLMYRQWGGDIINMSVIPEAKLAREAELDYTLICTSTDFDAWRTGYEPVTVEEVVKVLQTNAGKSRAVAAGILQDVHDAVVEGKTFTDIKGSMKFACVTRKDIQPETSRKKLSYILPYFSD
ncbi:methylthioadenosine phosphorylase [Cryptococcus neoformans Bt63]|nr:methylthioadenosine phosphorylase [Cryptococcus neoformans var. grubii Bt63]